MYQLIEIEDYYRKALSALTKQVSSLNRYIEKKDHNAEWAKLRKNDILDLGTYLQESKRIIKLLANELDTAYSQGKQAGKEEAEKEGRNDWRGMHSIEDILKNTFLPETELNKALQLRLSKEAVRKLTIEAAKAKWNELY